MDGIKILLAHQKIAVEVGEVSRAHAKASDKCELGIRSRTARGIPPARPKPCAGMPVEPGSTAQTPEYGLSFASVEGPTDQLALMNGIQIRGVYTLHTRLTWFRDVS